MKCKRWLSGLVAAAMLSTMTAGLPAVSAAETLPQPDYLFTFEQVADQKYYARKLKLKATCSPLSRLPTRWWKAAEAPSPPPFWKAAPR